MRYPASRSAPGTYDLLNPPRITYSTLARFLANLPPIDFLRLTPQDYRAELGKSPLKRAKRSGLLRNAAVAAGNAGGHASVPDLERVLAKEEDPVPRAHAAWALGKLGELEALRAALDSEQDPEVLAEIRLALDGAAG